MQYGNTCAHYHPRYAQCTLQTFLSSLEERQKDCRLYIDQIGDILDAHMSGMAVYMVNPPPTSYPPITLTPSTDDQPYCVHQAPAIKVLHGLRETNPELAGHLQARFLLPNPRWTR
jgi:hypothetical protein